MRSTRKFAQISTGAALALVLSPAAQVNGAPTPLDGSKLAKFVDALPRPGVLRSTPGAIPNATSYEVRMKQVTQKLHRNLPPTTVWGYNGLFPGPTIEARRYKPVVVKWINDLPTQHLLPVDTTVHGADGSNPAVRTVVHLHGGNVPAASDGGPDEWFVPGQSESYYYPNGQPGATLWYHDHALGATRLNVYAGLAGFYLIREDFEDKLKLPSGNYEIPLAIQDRSFNTDGSLFYPASLEPEFFGDTILVNGKVWPYLSVEPRKYRFRLLNGSNSRFYRLRLLESSSSGVIKEPWSYGPNFNQIGTDGGLLPAPVSLREILLAPGERADVVIDFSTQQGKYFVLHNDAETPYRVGATTSGAIPAVMQFKVTKPLAAPDNSVLPVALRPVPALREKDAVKVRDLTLEETVDEHGRLLLLLNGLRWDDPTTEMPRLWTTEVWRIINLTEDTHPIHLHLVQFQILDRYAFNPLKYLQTGKLELTGPSMPPDANEAGWKDTVRVAPGEVIRIIANFSPYAGRYVWHCHILEHEDHEMMRPFEVVTGRKSR